MISPPGLKANPCVSFLCTQWSKVEVNHGVGVRLCTLLLGDKRVVRRCQHCPAAGMEEGTQPGLCCEAGGEPSNDFKINYWAVT